MPDQKFNFFVYVVAKYVKWKLIDVRKRKLLVRSMNFIKNS